MTPLDIAFTRTATSEAVSDAAKPYRGRRMNWDEFYALRPDLRPANDNTRQEKAA